MLSKGWSGIFVEVVYILVFEILEYVICVDYIDFDRYLIKLIYYNLFSGEDFNKKL